MGMILSLIPLNIVALLVIVLYKIGLIHFMDRFHFAIVVAALLILTLSIEIVKSTRFAPNGALAWVDFFSSFLLLLGIFGYILYSYVKFGHFPNPLFWLVLEAQVMDVVVGFYVALTSARRDIGLEGS